MTMALVYHAGQIEVQEEANTRPAADNLAGWVGPVGQFASVADLFVLAAPDAAGDLRFAVVSGAAPLVEFEGGSVVRFAGLTLPWAEVEAKAGGIAISLPQLRRARINGWLTQDAGGCTLEADEAFTNCRKYVAPSMAVSDAPMMGPSQREAVGLDDAWLQSVIAGAETSFLASISPDGQPDVSHRGGLPGFLRLDAPAGTLSWDEFVGDGMLKSAGNVRATGRVGLLVLDLATGDAVELSGRAEYTTVRRYEEAREAPLEQHKERYPVQGAMSMRVEGAWRLSGVTAPRRRMEKALRVTSASATGEQAPR
jgi:hypothetical protein